LAWAFWDNDAFWDFVRDSIHPLQDCDNPTCYYCTETDAYGDRIYDELFARHLLRQDSGSNLVDKYRGGSYPNEGVFIHNNIFFVNDQDTDTPHGEFYGIRNVIFGYVYAPGSRIAFGTPGYFHSNETIRNHGSEYATAIGGYKLGDFNVTPNHIGDKLKVIHLMPADYHRHPDGRTTRGVVSEMVGESYRGMRVVGEGEGSESTSKSLGGFFNTVGYR